MTRTEQAPLQRRTAGSFYRPAVSLLYRGAPLLLPTSAIFCSLVLLVRDSLVAQLFVATAALYAMTRLAAHADAGIPLRWQSAPIYVRDALQSALFAAPSCIALLVPFLAIGLLSGNGDLIARFLYAHHPTSFAWSASKTDAIRSWWPAVNGYCLALLTLLVPPLMGPTVPLFKPRAGSYLGACARSTRLFIANVRVLLPLGAMTFAMTVTLAAAYPMTILLTAPLCAVLCYLAARDLGVA